MKYVPNEEDLHFLKTVRSHLMNREGKSGQKMMAEVARFPMEVHMEMSRIHGPGWVDKPGVLQQFLRENPQYQMGKPMSGLADLGTIDVNTGTVVR